MPNIKLIYKIGDNDSIETEGELISMNENKSMWSFFRADQEQVFQSDGLYTYLIRLQNKEEAEKFNEMCRHYDFIKRL